MTWDWREVGGLAYQVVFPVENFGDYSRMGLVRLLFVLEADAVSDSNRICRVSGRKTHFTTENCGKEIPLGKAAQHKVTARIFNNCGDSLYHFGQI